MSRADLCCLISAMWKRNQHLCTPSTERELFGKMYHTISTRSRHDSDTNPTRCPHDSHTIPTRFRNDCEPIPAQRKEMFTKETFHEWSTNIVVTILCSLSLAMLTLSTSPVTRLRVLARAKRVSPSPDKQLGSPCATQPCSPPDT